MHWEIKNKKETNKKNTCLNPQFEKTYHALFRKPVQWLSHPNSSSEFSVNPIKTILILLWISSWLVRSLAFSYFTSAPSQQERSPFGHCSLDPFLSMPLTNILLLLSPYSSQVLENECNIEAFLPRIPPPPSLSGGPPDASLTAGRINMIPPQHSLRSRLSRDASVPLVFSSQQGHQSAAAPSGRLMSFSGWVSFSAKLRK